MKRYLSYMLMLLLATSFQQCSYSQSTPPKQDTMDTGKKDKHAAYSGTDTSKVTMSEEEWKKILPAEIYSIARLKGTERPGTSAFEHSKEKGTFYCAACGNALFQSDAKFESGCGWPSFYQPISKSSIIYAP